MGILKEKNVPLAITLYRAEEGNNCNGLFAYSLSRAYAKNGSDSLLYWIEKAVEKDFKHAYVLYARLNAGGYVNTKGDTIVVRNTSKAVSLAEIGIKKGDNSAKELLASIYYSGELGKQKKTEAYSILSSIPEEKLSGESLFILSLMYHNGDGAVINLNKAFQLSHKSAELGYAAAMNYLGVAYEMGIGTQKNDSLAFEWYNKAANAGDAMAMNNVGHCYDNGVGTKTNHGVAIEWYKQAARNGEIASIEYLKRNHIQF